MDERVVRLAFIPLLGALLATFALSAYMGVTTGYTYGQEIRLETYSALAKGLGAVLGAGLLALIIVAHSLRMKEDQLQKRLIHWLEWKGQWAAKKWDEDMERALEKRIRSDEESEGMEVAEVLDERRALASLRRYSTRLFALPVAALAAIVAISFWAVPATGGFLENLSALNTTFIFMVSYGTPVALGALFTAFVVVLKE